MAERIRFKRLGAMVRLKRRKALLTMEDLGRKARGFSKGYLSGIERGKVNPPGFKMAQRVAAALEFPVEEFAVLCEIVKLPEFVLKRPRIVEEIEALYKACGEEPK